MADTLADVFRSNRADIKDWTPDQLCDGIAAAIRDRDFEAVKGFMFLLAVADRAGWHRGQTVQLPGKRADAMSMRPPAPDRDVPEGYELVAVPETSGLPWRIDTSRRCRWTEARKMCGKPSVAVLLRGTTGMPYGYCADHMYGRWIDDGKIMTWVLREIPASRGGGLSA